MYSRTNGTSYPFPTNSASGAKRTTHWWTFCHSFSWKLLQICVCSYLRCSNVQCMYGNRLFLTHRLYWNGFYSKNAVEMQQISHFGLSYASILMLTDVHAFVLLIRKWLILSQQNLSTSTETNPEVFNTRLVRLFSWTFEKGMTICAWSVDRRPINPLF